MIKKLHLGIITCLVIIIMLLSCSTYNQNYEDEKSKNKNGELIHAYKGFENFLNSDLTWENYEKLVIDPYPSIIKLHDRYRNYNLFNKDSFPKLMEVIVKRDFKAILENTSDQKLTLLYDSIITKCNIFITPKQEVDVCFFLGQMKDCLMFYINDRQTIMVSIEYNDSLMPLIIIHEYAHCLHHQYTPKATFKLNEYIISEGMASYFPCIVNKEASIYEGLWMMPKEAVDWCIENEQQIIDSIKFDLYKGGIDIEKKYICGGEGFAKPPGEFPEKTGYYIGYRIIEKCIEDYSIRKLCLMNPEEIITRSEFFK